MARRRILSILLLIGFFIFASSLLAVPLIAQNRVPVIDASTPLQFSRTVGTVDLRGELTLAVGRTVHVRLDARPQAADRARPLLFLEMPSHTMQPLPLSLDGSEAVGFTGRLALPMPGLWHLLLALPAGETTLQFLVED